MTTNEAGEKCEWSRIGEKHGCSALEMLTISSRELSIKVWGLRKRCGRIYEIGGFEHVGNVEMHETEPGPQAEQRTEMWRCSTVK